LAFRLDVIEGGERKAVFSGEPFEDGFFGFELPCPVLLEGLELVCVGG
jgi:hypothetical protein